MYYKHVSVFEFKRGMELVLLVGLLCTVSVVVNGVDFDPEPDKWIQGQYGSFSCSNPVVVIVNKNGVEVTSCTTDRSNFCPTPAPSYAKVTTTGNTLNFTILNVDRARDTANWGCGGTTTNIDVKVPVPSATIENKNSLTFTDGQTTSITCKTGVSYPPATITWSVGGTNINGATTTNNPDNTTTSILQYTPDKTDNNKILQCSATNGFPEPTSTKSDSMTLKITYVPTVTISPTGTVNVIGGKELKLTCVVVDAKPSVSSYTWSKDGSVISGEQNPTFIISSVQKSDEGSYTCAATNSVGTGQNSVQVTVRVVNGVDFDPEPDKWIQGQYGSFSCSHPILVIVKKNGNEEARCDTDGTNFCPTPAPSYATVTVTGNTLNFTILNVDRARDTANWECGGTTTYIDVKVPVPSATIENRNSLTFTDGQTTSITCKTGVSYPSATITWSVGGTNINGATTTNNPDGTTTSILQYTPDKTDHNKILQCSATNGFGSPKTESLTLIITCEDRFGVGFGVGVGVGVGACLLIEGVIVGVTLVILKIKGRTIALHLTSTKDTGPQFTNMASTSGTATSGVDEPSHYEGLNSETRENTAPTYQQLSVYQN